MYLDPAIICKLHSVVRNELVNLAVLVALALRVADQNDHLQACVNGARQGTYTRSNAREVCPWWPVVYQDRVISFSIRRKVFELQMVVQQSRWSATTSRPTSDLYGAQSRCDAT
jgi:hypothetical protein